MLAAAEKTELAKELMEACALGGANVDPTGGAEAEV